MSANKSIKRVLLANDLSAYSARVVERGALVAEELGAELTVLHVVDSRFVEAAAAIAKLRHAPSDPSALTHARERLDASVNSLRARYRLQSNSELMVGRPHQVVAAVAQLEEAGLVIVGEHSKETLIERMLGSTCDRVLRTVAVPALMVRNRPLDKYRTVLVATDHSDASRRALQVAIQVAPRARFRLFHVVDNHLERIVELLGASRAELDQYYAEAGAGASDRMDGDLASCAMAREQVTKVVEVGDPAELIVSRSEGAAVDLIVLGRHRTEGLGQYVLGRIARRVLDAAHSDVLIGPAG